MPYNSFVIVIERIQECTIGVRRECLSSESLELSLILKLKFRIRRYIDQSI